MPLQMLLVAIITLLVASSRTGIAKAEFHQPYYQNGFGLDSQLPLMPNHNHLEEQILSRSSAAGAAGNGELTGLGLAAIVATDAQQQQPSIDYYVRRKEILLPLIADLIRFHNLTTEVYEAYVLNVDHGHGMGDRNGTGRNETAGVVVTSVVIDSSSAIGGVGGDQSHDQLLLNELSYFDFAGAGGSPLSSVADELGMVEGGTAMSVLEQNLADLNDFCDSGSNTNNNNEATPYYSFNNLSYNLIPKDLMEATDLWSTAASFSYQNQRQQQQTQLLVRAAGDGGDRGGENGTRIEDGREEQDDPEERKYLQYIKKEGDEEEETEEAVQNRRNETEDTAGTTESRVAVKEEERDEFILKLEPFEDLIEELTEDSPEYIFLSDDDETETEQSVKVETLEEEENAEEGPSHNEADAEVKVEEDHKSIILVDYEEDAADNQEEEEFQPRDWFLNGNEVVRRPTSLRRSSTFDDIHVDELEDEVILLELVKTELNWEFPYFVTSVIIVSVG